MNPEQMLSQKPADLDLYVVFSFVLVVCFGSLNLSQQLFSHVGTSLPGLNQY